MELTVFYYRGPSLLLRDRSAAGPCSPYMEPDLTVELQACSSGRSNGAGGIRTPTGRVKSSLCSRYTTTPNMVGVSVSVVVVRTSCVLKKIARKGVEPLFPPYQSGVLNRWTTRL